MLQLARLQLARLGSIEPSAVREHVHFQLARLQLARSISVASDQLARLHEARE